MVSVIVLLLEYIVQIGKSMVDSMAFHKYWYLIQYGNFRHTYKFANVYNIY